MLNPRLQPGVQVPPKPAPRRGATIPPFLDGVYFGVSWCLAVSSRVLVSKTCSLAWAHITSLYTFQYFSAAFEFCGYRLQFCRLALISSLFMLSFFPFWP